MNASGEERRRRRARLRFASRSGILATALFLGGIAAASTSSDRLFHTLGVVAVGYGIGIGVAAVFIAFGGNPLRRP
jgi:hypothetical protein